MMGVWELNVDNQLYTAVSAFRAGGHSDGSGLNLGIIYHEQLWSESNPCFCSLRKYVRDLLLSP